MDIRRYHIIGAVYFITCVNHDRQPIFSDPVNSGILMDTLSRVREHHPHQLQAYVILPDHFHFLLEPEQSAISVIIQSLRRNFTCHYKRHHQIRTPVTLAQHRFYDHVIRNQEDMNRHLDYIHYNPVKHGLAEKPEDWLHSSYRDFVRKGHYEIGWGWKEIPGIRGMNPE